MGIHYQGKTEYTANYFRVSLGALSEGTRPNWDIFIQGLSDVVTASTSGAMAELKIAFHDRDLKTATRRTIRPGRASAQPS